MGQKVNVSLGITLCVNPELRNFVRLGIDAQEIDLAGDVDRGRRRLWRGVASTVCRQGGDRSAISSSGSECQ